MEEEGEGEIEEEMEIREGEEEQNDGVDMDRKGKGEDKGKMDERKFPPSLGYERHKYLINTTKANNRKLNPGMVKGCRPVP